VRTLEVQYRFDVWYSCIQVFTTKTRQPNRGLKQTSRLAYNVCELCLSDYEMHSVVKFLRHIWNK